MPAITTSTSSTITDQGERLRRPARTRTLRFDELRISHVADGAVQLKPRGWFPASTDEDWARYADHLDADGALVAGIGGLLVEYGDRALLIDAGFGPDAMPDDPGNDWIGALHGGRLLDSLAELGRSPADIEAVAVTHLHTDHIGWAWHPAPGSDRPAFTDAAYLFGEDEWNGRHRIPEVHGITGEILAALEPRARTVAEGEEVFPSVRVLSTPGHTVGHTAYVIESGGRRLIAFGDALHSPVQIGRPEWSAGPDVDADRSAEHRRRLVAELSAPDTFGYGIHFADVVFGRVERRTGTEPGSGRDVWVPVDGVTAEGE
ncbi:MBL fold metallo-hydrolase [Streptomyces cavernicola]|uniref:MBL fold metallo-hydrolase n=1 Tax=Streptomyces cavernicola TaxID=3043613 RepID=A0ABT6SFK8_9ACTN|nr:MBL fold metallo-hydrolase [Streptomyces sp. B-S-A6]MDI3406755.1 MBL fold metallo-hydrolase [Streptomyces sp. B-S-A6]